MVRGYEQFIPTMMNDTKDRHIAAAAVRAGADLIVTYNLRDFAVLPCDIIACSPDEFLLDLFDLNPRAVNAALGAIVDRRTKPPTTRSELLQKLHKLVPQFVAKVSMQ